MNIILFGPPGSGKGTQSKFIIKKFNLNLISLGNILRKYFKDNLNIKKIISSGSLIDNNLVFNIIKNIILKKNNKCGYLFDGFPRNIIQAKFLRFLNINYVIELRICNKSIFNRLLGRRIHLKSGRIYNYLYNPSKILDIDDITGEKLIFRDDDLNISIIKKRLSIYYYELIYLRSFYKKYFLKYKKNNYYFTINADQSINTVTKNIINILK